MTDENFEDAHWDRTELQYFYIPKLVDAVNNGCLPSTALHMVDEWDFWDECDREEGFDVDWLEVGKDHTVIFYNFPEPRQIPEALYGAVLINNITGKAKYYTLEYGYLDSRKQDPQRTSQLWIFGFPGAKCNPEVGHRQDCRSEIGWSVSDCSSALYID